MADWISKQARAAQSAAGNFAGGAVNSFGTGISDAGRNVGDNISKTTLGWANATREYGNGIKDASDAKGARAPTAANPLGMAKTPTSVKVEKQRKAAAGKQTGRDPLGISGKY